jgi:hypothetical protein
MRLETGYPTNRLPNDGNFQREGTPYTVMIDKCFLHIGTEKTGTTSIQEFLATNRRRLQAHRYLYPKSPGALNHLGLTCYAQDDDKFDGVRRLKAVSSRSDVIRYRASLLAALDGEIGKSNSTAVIFSNEHLSSRLTTTKELRRLKELCERYARVTRIIVYIRDQVGFLASRYIEGIKGGATRSLTLPIRPGVIRLMDYEKLLAPWREVFGIDNMHVRRFVNTDFCGGDLLLDFESIIGISAGVLETSCRRNSALSQGATEFLREFNNYVPHLLGEIRNPLRGSVVQLLEQFQDRDPFYVPTHVAEHVENLFRASNEVVSRDYFNSKYNPLFEKRQTVSVSHASPKGDHASDMIRIAAHLWIHQQQELLNCKHSAGKSQDGKTT